MELHDYPLAVLFRRVKNDIKVVCVPRELFHFNKVHVVEGAAAFKVFFRKPCRDHQPKTPIPL